MHGLSDVSQVGRASSQSLMVKSEDRRENISIPDLVKDVAPEKEDCFP